MRGRLCPARGLQGPSVAQSTQPGDDHDHDGDDEDDDNDDDGEQCDLFSKKEL